MFRKLLVVAVASLGLLSPLAVTSQADAHAPRHEVRHVRYVYPRNYRVFYQDPCRPGWIFGGAFPNQCAANQFAMQFRTRGFAIEVR